jgi:hypothetical protein
LDWCPERWWCYRAAGEGQGWTKSNQKLSMGIKLGSACKVFVEMAARKLFSNFGNSFGGSHSYNLRDRMVVVGFNLEKKCKMAKVR